MFNAKAALLRSQVFAKEFGLQAPILLAPMAGATPPSLSIAVANGGGMGACGVLMMTPDQIASWVHQMRSGSNGAFQLNTWVPDPKPERDREREAEICQFLNKWGPEVPDAAADAPFPDFDSQCDAILKAGPAVVSSIMGLYPAELVAQLKVRKIKWFATVTTVSEALEAEKAGADVIIAQGMEAGGHRRAFVASQASNMIGLFSLLPAVVDAVEVPVIATGGIGDDRGIAASLILGASGVQIGTGFLRAPEASIASAWSDAIGRAAPEDTVASRVFSGRLGRSLRTEYTNAATSPLAPDPAPYPIQRNLTQAMREEAVASNDLPKMQAWAGQSGRLAQAIPAKEIVNKLWNGAQFILKN